MNISPFILTALVNYKLPHIKFTQVSDLIHGNENNKVNLILKADKDIYELKISKTEKTNQEITNEAYTTYALSKQLKNLEFDIPKIVLKSLHDGLEYSVYEISNGAKINISALKSDTILLKNIIDSIKELHNTNFYNLKDIAKSSLSSIRYDIKETLEKAYETDIIPKELLTIWHQTFSLEKIWNFSFCLINGSLNVESFIADSESNKIICIKDWQSAEIGDPAKDLIWLLEADSETTDKALEYYCKDYYENKIMLARIIFYSQMDALKWFLYGLESKNMDVKKDALSILKSLSNEAIELDNIINYLDHSHKEEQNL